MTKKHQMILLAVIAVGVVGYYFVNKNIKKGATTTVAAK